MEPKAKPPLWVLLFSLAAVALSLAIIFVASIRTRPVGLLLVAFALPLCVRLFVELKRSGRGHLPVMQAGVGAPGIHSLATLIEWLAMPLSAVAVTLAL